ncbi:MAG: hypothetical protein M3Z17_05825 [Gemmatimonadota bacterium]|nr:hypothetical protein [Gemmatimonadota bacterium]
MIRRAIFFLILAVAGVSSPARSQPAPVIRLAGGRTVEVLGLRRWTIAMIQDSLRKYSPGDSLQNHACAAVLRYKLHFADASSTTYEAEGHPNRVVVTVREPQDSARVHLPITRYDSTGGLPEWRQFVELERRRPDIFYPATQSFLFRTIGGSRSHRYSTQGDSAQAERLVSFLRERRTTRDRRLALIVISSDPNFGDRMIAALTLANFPASDDAWRALVVASREDGHLLAVASNTLSTLSAVPRRVDWRPIAGTIRLMLAGNGGLFGLPSVVRALNASGVGPRYAAPFLAGGAEMLVNYLDSSNEILSQPARSLLIKLRGSDLGADSAKWRAWISTL